MSCLSSENPNIQRKVVVLAKRPHVRGRRRRRAAGPLRCPDHRPPLHGPLRGYSRAISINGRVRDRRGSPSSRRSREAGEVTGTRRLRLTTGGRPASATRFAAGPQAVCSVVARNLIVIVPPFSSPSTTLPYKVALAGACRAWWVDGGPTGRDARSDCVSGAGDPATVGRSMPSSTRDPGLAVLEGGIVDDGVLRKGRRGAVLFRWSSCATLLMARLPGQAGQSPGDGFWVNRKGCPK